MIYNAYKVYYYINIPKCRVMNYLNICIILCKIRKKNIILLSINEISTYGKILFVFTLYTLCCFIESATGNSSLMITILSNNIQFLQHFNPLYYHG